MTLFYNFYVNYQPASSIALSDRFTICVVDFVASSNFIFVIITKLEDFSIVDFVVQNTFIPEIKKGFGTD